MSTQATQVDSARKQENWMEDKYSNPADSQKSPEIKQNEKDAKTDAIIEIAKDKLSRKLPSKPTEVQVTKKPKKPVDPNKSYWSRIKDFLINQDNDQLDGFEKTRKFLDFCFKDLIRLSAKIPAACNLVGAALQILPVEKYVVDWMEKFATRVTQLSFIPYGAAGVLNGIRKNNLIQAFAFFGEPILAFMGDLKDIYVLRGAATGMDQLPVATEKITKKIFGSAKFPDMTTGVVEMLKAMGQLSKEIVKNPIKTLFTMKPQGHMAFLSSIGDIISTIGYIFTKKEDLFGPIRDLSAFAFDIEMIFSSKPKERLAGCLFIVEQFLDFFARKVPTKFRLMVNQLSHVSGRLALDNYLASYEEDMEKKDDVKQEAESKTGAAKEPVAEIDGESIFEDGIEVGGDYEDLYEDEEVLMQEGATV